MLGAQQHVLTCRNAAFCPNEAVTARACAEAEKG
jgi:hypothetical protein